jgi:hypothetical protein
MKLQIVVYAGTIAMLLSTGTPAFSEPAGSSTMRSGNESAAQPVIPETELPGGKADIPEPHADDPVLQGKSEEVEDSKYLNATVYNINGEEIGKIQQVLKDTKSGVTEYIVFVSKESKL